MNHFLNHFGPNLEEYTSRLQDFAAAPSNSATSLTATVGLDVSLVAKSPFAPFSKFTVRASAKAGSSWKASTVLALAYNSHLPTPRRPKGKRTYLACKAR